MNEKLRQEPFLLTDASVDIMPSATLSNINAIMNFEEVLRGMPVGRIALDREFFFDTENSEVKVELLPVEHFSDGRKNSMHGVWFGRAVVSCSKIIDRPVSVAVKSFTPQKSLLNFSDPVRLFDTPPVGNPVESLTNEWAAHKYLGEISSLERGLLPVGVWRYGEDDYRLLTLFDEPITTFDNVLWARGKKAKDVTDDQIVHALSEGLFANGLLNGGGVAMIDAQYKNTGIDFRYARLSDLEKAVLLEIDNEIIVNSKSNRTDILGDLNKLLASAVSTKEVDHQMYNRVGGLMTEQRVQRSMYRGYLAGMKHGEKYSDLFLHNKLVVDEASLVARINKAIEIEAEKR